MASTNSDEKQPERRRKKACDDDEERIVSMARTNSDEKRPKLRRLKKARIVEKEESDKEMNKFTRIQSDVSMTLAKHVLCMNKVKDKNVVLSPVSLHVILGFMASGFCASDARKEILSYLKSESSEEFNSLISQLMELVFAVGSANEGPRLSFANGMWIDQSLKLKDSFKELVVDKAYKAIVKTVDFQTKADEVRREANVWAEKETNGLIKEFFGPGSVTSSTSLIFANALYFKGKWKEKFDASMTRDKYFFLLNGDVIRAPFITSNKSQQIREFDGFKVLRMPYKKGKDERKYSMYIYLPKAKDGLADFVERFCSESGFFEKHVPYDKPVDVENFRFPKFKISFEFEACKALKKLGMASAFCDPLIEIAEDVRVTKVLQKSLIEVNEGGTEVATVTSLWDEECCCGPAKFMKINFVADHPFLFVIKEDTSKMVLFVGQVLNPLASE